MTISNATSLTGKVWFITGASTGFGLVLAKQALENGDKVVATARKPEGELANLDHYDADRALVLPLDVTKQNEIDSAVAQAIAKFGRIDVLVNNAGYGIVGAIEEASPDEYMPVFETNVFGLIRVTQAALPHMREQRSGHIINLSSVGGLTARQGFGIYNASKFAVEGLTEALAEELQPFNIKVTIIEPGPFRTEFLGRSGVHMKRMIPGYKASAGESRAYMADQDGKQKGDPERAAKAIRDIADMADPPLRLLLGAGSIARVLSKLDKMKRDIETWAEVTRGADFPDGE